MSTLRLVVDEADPAPPFEQVRRQLEALIRSGALEPGRRLPPVRQLASDLGLAVGTVARSYSELEAQGMVTSRRGAGTRVSLSPPTYTARERRGAVRLGARAFVQQARLVGATDEDIRAALDHALRGLGAALVEHEA